MLLIASQCSMYSEAQLESEVGRWSSAPVPTGELRKQKRLRCSGSCWPHIHQCGNAADSS